MGEMQRQIRVGCCGLHHVVVGSGRSGGDSHFLRPRRPGGEHRPRPAQRLDHLVSRRRAALRLDGRSRGRAASDGSGDAIQPRWRLTRAGVPDDGYMLGNVSKQRLPHGF